MKTAAIDIETTGISPSDQITVVGIDIPLGSRVFLQTDGENPELAYIEEIESDFDGLVNITVHHSEADLLRAFRTFAEARFRSAEKGDADEFKFAAYNGETWKGGFDLPFIRTRCQEHGVGWPLHGPYIDVMEVVTDRFNVSDNSLETTYAELVAGGLNESDPYDDSAEAVTDWQNGEFEALLRHNLADIRRTRALVDVAEQYCSTSHFSMRSLEPINSG